MDQQAKDAQAKRGPVLHVFSSKSEDGKDPLVTFSKNAAAYVKSLIVRAPICGIGFGNTLFHLVEALRTFSGGQWGKQRPTFVPLSGDAWGNRPTRLSSSTLVWRLSKLASLPADAWTPSLGMIPAVIPFSLKEERERGVRLLMELVKDYTKIFGRDGLAEQCDMILTSVGPADSPHGVDSKNFANADGPGKEDLQRILVGDMAGVCYAKPDLTKTDVEIVKELNRRWTGVQEPALRKCAERAFRRDPGVGPPGLVVVAIGPRKAAMVIEAVRMGLNQLIIDQDLQREIERMLGISPA